MHQNPPKLEGTALFVLSIAKLGCDTNAAKLVLNSYPRIITNHVTNAYFILDQQLQFLYSTSLAALVSQPSFA